MYQIIKNRNIWLSVSAIFVAVSIVFLLFWGLKLGIDFTGGSLLEVEFKGERPSVNQVREAASDLELGELVVQPISDQNMVLRFQNIDEEKHQKLLERLGVLAGGEEKTGENASTTPSGEAAISQVEELRFDSVGPTIGAELKRKSISSIIIVLMAIVAYIAWAFRKVSKPVASWKFGIAAIIALFHDVMITIGVFAILGHFYDLEINTPFVAAILTVLGYSVNDTIVVFDRIREQLPKSEDDFETTVNNSVNATIQRSINTSVTTLMVLVSVLIFGGSSIREFILALSIGVFIGTYSSIFLASPLLVVWEKLRDR